MKSIYKNDREKNIFLYFIKFYFDKFIIYCFWFEYK